jgi:hypothetical protein
MQAAFKRPRYRQRLADSGQVDHLPSSTSSSLSVGRVLPFLRHCQLVPGANVANVLEWQHWGKAALRGSVERARVQASEGNAVPSVVVLEGIELVPVLKLEPFRFAAGDRSAPSGIYEDMPEEWYRYWVQSLADSGITGLMPVERGSWHVPTSEFTGPELLERVLELIFQNLSEAGFSIDLECLPLDGGLALRCQSQNVLIEPGCCGDLGNAASWRRVAGYRRAEWHPLWIGHPSLSVLYRAPRLIISSPHDAEDPTARWAVCPDQLQVAIESAEIELERFARQIAVALPSDYKVESRLMGRKLAGLGP